jgi:hypothetical protein
MDNSQRIHCDSAGMATADFDEEDDAKKDYL